MASEYLGTGCMRCDKTAAVYLQDSQCGITLCGECKDYFYAITTDKQRLRPVYCDEGHKLCLMKRIQRQCKKCKVAKNIELICLQCEGKEIYYCFQCKTIPLDTCYFDHPLTTAPPESTQIRTCSICSQQHSEHKACKRCKFYVCSPCHSLNSCSSSLLGQFSQLSINWSTILLTNYNWIIDVLPNIDGHSFPASTWAVVATSESVMQMQSSYLAGIDLHLY